MNFLINLVKIRVKSEKHCQKYDGKVVYKCPDVQQYDLGVLKIVNADTDFLRGSTCSFAADVKEGMCGTFDKESVSW